MLSSPCWLRRPGPSSPQTLNGSFSPWYWCGHDTLGSIINILDENEALKTTYSYDAFGEPTATYHSGQVDCMYRFTGRAYDSAMGNYFYRARYYNQSLGRFFSRDPIMSLSSLYGYCGNSPTNFTDPTGMVVVGGNAQAGRILADTTKEEKQEEEESGGLPEDPPPYNPLADLNGDGVVTKEEYSYYLQGLQSWMFMDDEEEEESTLARAYEENIAMGMNPGDAAAEAWLEQIIDWVFGN